MGTLPAKQQFFAISGITLLSRYEICNAWNASKIQLRFSNEIVMFE